MSQRGPKLEQIDSDNPTFRVEVEEADGSRRTWQGGELLWSHDAYALAKVIFVARPHLSAVHVVNERTGFTRDSISRWHRCFCGGVLFLERSKWRCRQCGLYPESCCGGSRG